MTNFMKDGKCSKCGSCCSNFIPLTEEEIKELKELVKKPDTEVQIKYDDKGRFYFMCPFLILNAVSKETRCSIYENRPSICRLFRCDKPNEKLPLEEAKKYRVVDMLHEIVNYDYQKDIGMTFEEARYWHNQKCLADREHDNDKTKRV